MKCCIKVNPGEKVGVVCVKNGQYDIVEYSELTPEQAEQKREDDETRLHLELGSILIFMLESKKLLSLCESAAKLNSLYHKAFKKIEYYDKESGETKKPASENAHKFELFLHNFLPFCNSGKFGVMCVERAQEFAPVKNADKPGETVADSPSEARGLMTNQHANWLKNLGEDIASKVEGKTIELDVLHCYQGEQISKQIGELITDEAEQYVSLPRSQDTSV